MEHGRRRARCRDRLLRRRKQLRRHRAAVRAGQACNGSKVRLLAVEPAACPTLTKGIYRLRFRRHGQAHADDQDVYAGPRFRAAGHSRRRIALSRRLAAGEPPAEARLDRGSQRQSAAMLRSGGASSRRPKAFCPRPNLRTPSARPSTKPCRRKRKASRAPFCSA